MTREQITLVIKKREDLLEQNPNLRKGQAFYLMLSTYFYHKAMEITATKFDPFYEDKKIPKCINYLLNH